MGCELRERDEVPVQSTCIDSSGRAICQVFLHHAQILSSQTSFFRMYLHYLSVIGPIFAGQLAYSKGKFETWFNEYLNAALRDGHEIRA